LVYIMNPSQLSLGQRPIIIKQYRGSVKLFSEQFPVILAPVCSFARTPIAWDGSVDGSVSVTYITFKIRP